MIKSLVIGTLLALGMATLGVTGALHHNRKRKVHDRGQITGTKPKISFIQPRIVAAVLALALGQFLYLRVHSAWINYWLLADGQKGMAQITGERWSGHGAMEYQYSVSGRDYTGYDSRNQEEEKYSNAKVGDESIVYYSTSHPWISLLNKPRGVVEGLPVIILVLIIESLAVFTIIRPQCGWALDLSDKKHK